MSHVKLDRSDGSVATVNCILLAALRSGTTVLGDSVSRAFGAVLPKEIFVAGNALPDVDYRRDSNVQTRTNFFNFRRDLYRSRPELSYPTRQNQEYLFRAYLEHIERLEKASKFLIDIKYSSFHHLDSFYRFAGDPPGLIEIIRCLDLPVVHLRRNNLFARYCSLTHALNTDIWATTTCPGDFTPFAVDTADCLDHMARNAAIADQVDGWFEGRRIYQLEYETLWENGRWSPVVSQTFEDIFGPPVAPLAEPRLRKVMPPLRSMITNRDEVLSALRGTAFLPMAEAELS